MGDRVDTHQQAHTAALVDRLGGVPETLEFAADPTGYRRVLAWVAGGGGLRVWGVEGTGSYGAGLAGLLQAVGGRVVEVERPARPPRRDGANSDAVDAGRAAREVLAGKDLLEPRRRGEREAVRVLLATRNGAVMARTKARNHLQALVVTAPGRLRSRLDGLTGGPRPAGGPAPSSSRPAHRGPGGHPGEAGLRPPGTRLSARGRQTRS